MQRITPGLVTTTSTGALAPFDEFSRFRVAEWENMPADPKMRYQRNPVALLEFAKSAPLKQKTIKNPKVNYTIDGALANYTQATAAVNASATELVIEDIDITSVGQTLTVVSTQEELVVAAVDVATSTITLVRGTHGPAFAIPAGAELRPGSPVIGEAGKLKDAHTSYPGDPSYNYITLSGLKFEMTEMQAHAAMVGDWGTWDMSSEDTKYQLEYQLQNALIFQHRGTYYDSTEEQVYRGAGLMDQLSGNMLDLGDAGTNSLWEIWNDFVNPMFASNLSADTKDVFCGHNLWADLLTTARQRQIMEGEISIHTTYGSDVFTIHTTEGKRLNIHNVGGMDGEMANLGLVLDANNIGGSQYDGLGPQWFLNLQANDEVLKRSAGYFTSWETHIFDRTTMGIVRGGTKSLIV